MFVVPPLIPFVDIVFAVISRAFVEPCFELVRGVQIDNNEISIHYLLSTVLKSVPAVIT